MSLNRLVSCVSGWMKSKHLLVPDDWISACLEWISSEGQNLSNETVVKKMVYEQYLLTDLRDFLRPVLPGNIGDEVLTLKGIYCVQIDNVLDVSQPKYSQLLQRQNKESGNMFITAETQATQKPWESKPSRVLMLSITDGMQDASAMEYGAIPKLSEKTPPGTKICIKGPVTCRRGVLMLKQSNVEILGGEVEDLFQNNNYEAVLCQGLGRPLPATQSVTEPQNEPKNQGHSDIRNDDLHDILADAEFDEELEVRVQEGTRQNRVSDGTEAVRVLGENPVITISDDEELLGVLEDADNDENIEDHRNFSASYDVPKTVNPESNKTDKGQDLKNASSLLNVGNLREKYSSNLKFQKEFECNAPKNAANSYPEAPPSKSCGKKIHPPNQILCENKIGSSTAKRTFSTYINSGLNSNAESFYLCNVKQHLGKSSESSSLNIRIKAVVITLLSKLNSDISSGWSLKARICDGTDMLDVEFENNVLEALIGFSVPTAESVKRCQVFNEKNELKCGLENCREKIITMCHFMDVKVTRNQASELCGFVKHIEF